MPADLTSWLPPEDAGKAGQAAAASALVKITEDLARYLRVVTGGELSLAVVRNRATTARDRQGVPWDDAFLLAAQAAGETDDAAVRVAAAAILRGQLRFAEHELEQTTGPAPAAG